MARKVDPKVDEAIETLNLRDSPTRRRLLAGAGLVSRAIAMAHGTPVLADGTRHRSAYRLCSRLPDALAIVVSQDGGVRFVCTHRGEVMFWEHAMEALEL